MATTQDQRE